MLLLGLRRSVSKRQICSLPFPLLILRTIQIDYWLILLSPSHKRPHCFGEGPSESGVRIFDARRNRRIGLALDCSLQFAKAMRSSEESLDNQTAPLIAYSIENCSRGTTDRASHPASLRPLVTFSIAYYF